MDKTYSELKAVGAVSIVEEDGAYYCVTKTYDRYTGERMEDEKTPVTIEALEAQRKTYQNQIADCDNAIATKQAELDSVSEEQEAKKANINALIDDIDAQLADIEIL